MTALVTGGGGFLGGWIVRALRARGDAVRVLARRRTPALDGLDVGWVEGDLRDPAAVARAVRGVTSVIHVAAKPGYWGPYAEYRDANVTGTQHVIDACRAAGVGVLVHTSTPSVVFDGPLEGADEERPYARRWLCAYPETKAEAERRVLAAHAPGRLHTVALRPHLVFGPGDRHLLPRLRAAALAGRLPVVGDGRNRVSVTYVENAAAAHLAALDAVRAPDAPAGGRAYFVAEPEPVVLWDFLHRVFAALGVPAPRRRVRAGPAYALGAACEIAYRLLRLGGEPPLTRFLVAQLAESHWFSVERARRELGWTSHVSLDEGVRRLVAHERRQEPPAARCA